MQVYGMQNENSKKRGQRSMQTLQLSSNKKSYFTSSRTELNGRPEKSSWNRYDHLILFYKLSKVTTSLPPVVCQRDGAMKRGYSKSAENVS